MLGMLGVLFILSIQPMMVISSMILIVVFYALLMFWNLSSFWFSYMVVLVLMSGVLVIFTYMMSVLPNESFELSSLVFVILGVLMLYKYEENLEILEEVSLGSMKLWGGMMLMSSTVLVIYLFMMMIMVVWMSILEGGGHSYFMLMCLIKGLTW